MTDDIVVRLRQYRRLVGGEVYPEICGEAADEIERLRARIAELEAQRAPAP